MNSSKAIRTIVAIGILIVGLLVAVSVFSSNANRLREFIKFFGIGVFCLSIFQPRFGFIVVIVSTGYSDLIKRFMVLDSSLQFVDLYFVLGFTPLVLLGVCIGVFLRKLFSSTFTEQNFLQFAIAILVCMGLGGVIFFGRGGGMMSQLVAVAQAVSYATLIFVVPFLFPKVEERIALLRIVVLIFIPVAAYAIYQFVFGLSDFEYAYLETGLSGEARHLGQGKHGVDYRLNFSTLNSSVAVSTICSLFCVLAAMRFRPFSRTAKKWFYPGLPLLAVPLFALAAISTLTRAGWFAGIVAGLCLFFFRFRSTTVLVYFVGVLLVSSLFAFPDAWKDRLREGFVDTDSEVGHLAARTQTWQARTSGFIHLKEDRGLWTPFGIERESGERTKEEWTQLTHDIITYSIMKYGYVLSFVALVFLSIAVVLIHRSYFRLEEGNEKRLYLLSLSFVIAIGATGITNTSALQIFPINFYFWLFVGFMATQVRLRAPVEVQGEVSSADGVEGASMLKST